MDPIFKLIHTMKTKFPGKNAEITTIAWLMGAMLLGSPAVFSMTTI